jgi:type II secretory pathway pseudopilin PulG
MRSPSRQRGTLLLLLLVLALAAIAGVVAMDLAAAAGGAQRERLSESALAQAREALIAYAVDRPITAAVGPGYLPCPDLDNDGWAEATCGSLSGDTGQEQRLGRLPWKTLGLPDLRDGYGERLWYAVSSKYKGLLNCGASHGCLDMSPDSALGTITVRDASGVILHDGTIAESYRANEGGAIAVIFAPGAPISRADGTPQSRECASGDCDTAARCVAIPPQHAATCDPGNYLDKAADARFSYEDNADFVDRNDAAGRPRNDNGFIAGPVMLPSGRLGVNDRLTVISYRDLMPRLMERVAREVVSCLTFYASRPENGGRLPWPAPVCRQSSGDWAGRAGVHFGRIPDTPFDAMSANGRLERWWRVKSGGNLTDLPSASSACRIAVAPDDPGPVRASPPGTPADEAGTAGLAANSWWTAWKPAVFYALAPAYGADSGAASCDAGACIDVLDTTGRTVASRKQFAVLVSGPALASDGFVQSRGGGGISAPGMWLEESNARLEAAAGCEGVTPPSFPCEGTGTCNRVTAGAPTASFNDVVIASP